MHKDIDTEKVLISLLLNHGEEAFHEIGTLGISESTFYDSTNKIVYKCLDKLFSSDNIKSPDIPLIIDTALSFNLKNWVDNTDLKTTLEQTKAENLGTLENAKKYGQKLRKLEVTNNIMDSVEGIQDELEEITGQERLSEIFGLVENRLSNLAGFLTDQSVDPVKIGNVVGDHIRNLVENPIDQIGIPTGYGLFDKIIGGGLRRHAITVIAARSKVGKSTFCKNIAKNISKEGIPVLILDTEMETEDQINRLIASTADVPITEVETGKFNDNLANRESVYRAINEIQGLDIQHKNIAGMSIDEQLAIARKWIIRDVGLEKDGKAKECVLVYDYIKMMDSKELKDMQEHQALGFLITKLQNFAVKYDIPILTAVQLNRDGIEKENTAAISGSDRIAMFCSSICILKWKAPEEIDMEDNKQGNQKLVPVISRYGPPADGSHINIMFKPETNIMSEVGMSSYNEKKQVKKQVTKKSKDKEYQITF